MEEQSEGSLRLHRIGQIDVEPVVTFGNLKPQTAAAGEAKVLGDIVPRRCVAGRTQSRIDGTGFFKGFGNDGDGIVAGRQPCALGGYDTVFALVVKLRGDVNACFGLLKDDRGVGDRLAGIGEAACDGRQLFFRSTASKQRKERHGTSRQHLRGSR